GVVGVSYNTTLVGAGGKTPYGWTIASGTLPAGLTLTTGGVITGTPSAAGSSDFTVRLTDSSDPPQSIIKLFNLRIAGPLTIVTSSLPVGIVGTPYAQQALAGSGGTTPYTWQASGILPPGVNLSASGIFSGTPAVAGTFTFTVRLTDSGVPPQTTT